MKGVFFVALGLSIFAILFLRDSDDPTAEQIIAAPRQEIYASLDRLYAAVERKAAVNTTVTGDPPLPVKFSFEREDGEMLALKGEAGMRTVEVKTWLSDGDRPGETKMKVKFWPESLFEKAGTSDLRRAVERTLELTEVQFVEGKRITALFGGAATQHSNSRSSSEFAQARPSTISAASKPMLDPTAVARAHMAAR